MDEKHQRRRRTKGLESEREALHLWIKINLFCLTYVHSDRRKSDLRPGMKTISSRMASPESYGVCCFAGTVVKVDDRRVSGDTGVKVGHERGDVLRRRQHPMDHIACVDEP